VLKALPRFDRGDHADTGRPIYSQTTNDGHFGKIDDLATFTWERTDKAAALKKAVGK
jgi:S-adenosylmethionine synthetase